MAVAVIECLHLMLVVVTLSPARVIERDLRLMLVVAAQVIERDLLNLVIPTAMMTRCVHVMFVPELRSRQHLAEPRETNC